MESPDTKLMTMRPQEPPVSAEARRPFVNSEIHITRVSTTLLVAWGSVNSLTVGGAADLSSQMQKLGRYIFDGRTPSIPLIVSRPVALSEAQKQATGFHERGTCFILPPQVRPAIMSCLAIDSRLHLFHC